MTRFDVKARYVSNVLPQILSVAFLLTSTSVIFGANNEELKPGDIIGPHNWSRVQGMVGENLLQRIQEGYTFEIKEAYHFQEPAEYIEATRRYSKRVRLGADGRLLNYVAGRPFPEISDTDPEAGLKMVWNFFWRWLGDDYKNGGYTREGKIIRDVIEKDGSERRGAVVNHAIRTRGRVTIDPKPFIPGYNHIDWMQLRADEYPRDTAGRTTLQIRFADPDVEDDFYIYIPSIRRIRRVPPIQRCATIAPSEFNFDDINSFNGKITNFTYKFLGEKKMLGSFSQQEIPFDRRKGDYLPVDAKWAVHDTYAVEIRPKDDSYCYPKKVIYIHKRTWEVIWVMIWDENGHYWKEQFGFRVPVKLPDGREVWSTASVVIVNVKNGRSTVLTIPRRYNQGYKPTLFSLATLQKVLRGGSIR